MTEPNEQLQEQINKLAVEIYGEPLQEQINTVATEIYGEEISQKAVALLRYATEAAADWDEAYKALDAAHAMLLAFFKFDHAA